jgi:prepilin peptidase CpaA
MMPVLVNLPQAVLVITACVLLYAAFVDLRHYTIRNEFILVLAGLFVVHALVSGRWAEIHWNIGFALLMFLLMLLAYARNMMGGGDLKILTVAFLWVGVHCAFPFALFLALFALLYAVAAKFGWVASQQVQGRTRVAFAPAVAAALISSFMIGCLQPVA